MPRICAPALKCVCVSENSSTGSAACEHIGDMIDNGKSGAESEPGSRAVGAVRAET